MGIVIQISQFLLSIAFLILVHELGHFLVSRAFKVRVDKFYLFFNPWMSLVRAKRVNGKWQLSWLSKEAPTEWDNHPENTEYGLGWLPLGGYCKISGMIDESMDTEAMKKPAQPWEFRAHPAWQRFFIITGGVLVNFVTALIIYSMLLFVWGEAYIPVSKAKYGYDYCQTALKSGFENGDRLVSIHGVFPETVNEAARLIQDGGREVVVLRGTDTLCFTLPQDTWQQMITKEKFFANERVPFVLDDVSSGSAAAQAHLQIGDSITGVNGTLQALSRNQVMDSLLAYANNTITLNFYRSGQLMSQEIIPNKNGKLGVVLRPVYSFFEIKRQEYGFFESIPAGISQGTNTLVGYVKSFKHIASKDGVKSLGGFGTIGGLFEKTWSWPDFWNVTALLSIILAFMNILPIPALDGGHMMFILYEMVTRRKPSDKFLERAQMVGFILLITLLLYANGNDVVKWIMTKF